MFRLDRSQTPTLAIRGQFDPYSAEDDLEAIAKHYQPAARVVTFPRSARVPWIEQEARFLETLQRFLEVERRGG